MTTETTEIVTEQLAIIRDILKEDHPEDAKVAANIQKMLKTGKAEIIAIAVELLRTFAELIEDDPMAHGLAMAASKLVTLP